jgi:hypothetical protein
VQRNHFFYMKVGPGNCFLRDDIRDCIGGLHVGFAGSEIPIVNENGMLPAPTNVSKDLLYLTVCSQEANRSKVRVVTFGPEEMTVWEITGRLRTMECLNNKELLSDFEKVWGTGDKKNARGIPWAEYVQNPKTGYKVLPVKRDFHVKRARLWPSIDSLATHPYLVQGTFRPFGAIRQDWKPKELSFLPPPEIIKLGQSDQIPLSLYGQWVSYYIENVARANREPDGKPPAANSVSCGFSIREFKPHLWALLSPAQIETAAFMLMQDLGLTVDVAIGKSKDHIDVRASCRHREDRDVVINKALGVLSEMMTLSEEFRKSCNREYVIFTQCKNRPIHPDDCGTRIRSRIFVGTDRSIVSSDVLNLRDLFAKVKDRPNLFPRLDDWLKCLEYDFNR